MLSSRESFLNGFELHLGDDIDALAVESFWAFVSGGSPLLSAFEWILMVHHIGKLEEVVEREVVEEEVEVEEEEELEEEEDEVVVEEEEDVVVMEEEEVLEEEDDMVEEEDEMVVVEEEEEEEVMVKDVDVQQQHDCNVSLIEAMDEGDFAPPTSINVHLRSSLVAQEPLKARSPIYGFFRGLPPPDHGSTLADALDPLIQAIKSGQVADLTVQDMNLAIVQCHDNGLDVKQFQEVDKPSRLTAAGIAAINLYTGEFVSPPFYSVLNTALRDANREKCKPFVPYIWLLMHALRDCPLFDKKVVFRGVKADLSSQYPKDRVLTWFQFSSCTCDLSVEQSQQFCGSSGVRTLFTIELTTGRARMITMYSLVPSEAEVLLPPNSRFKVKGTLDAGNGLMQIQLEELPCLEPILDFDGVSSLHSLSDLSAPEMTHQSANASCAASHETQSISRSTAAGICIDGNIPNLTGDFFYLNLVVLFLICFMQLLQSMFKLFRLSQATDNNRTSSSLLLSILFPKLIWLRWYVFHILRLVILYFLKMFFVTSS